MPRCGARRRVFARRRRRSSAPAPPSSATPRGDWEMPAKVYVEAPPGGDFRAMPARGDGLATLKWVTSFPGNPARGLPVVTGALLVSSAETGELLAIWTAPRSPRFAPAPPRPSRRRLLARADARTGRPHRLRRQRRLGGALPGRRRATSPGVCFDPRAEAAEALAGRARLGDRRPGARPRPRTSSSPSPRPTQPVVARRRPAARPAPRGARRRRARQGRGRARGARRAAACSATSGSRPRRAASSRAAVSARARRRATDVTEIGAVLLGRAAGRTLRRGDHPLRLDRPRDPGPRDRARGARGRTGGADRLAVTRRLTRSQLFATLSLRSALTRSRPAPHRTLSRVPSRAEIRSRPPPPLRVSAPLPPFTRSPPRPPWTQSSPPLAAIRSAPPRPRIRSPPPVPRRTSPLHGAPDRVLAAPRGGVRAGVAARVGDQQLDVSVLRRALAARIGRAGAGAGLGVVVGERPPDRGELLGGELGRRARGRGRGVARVIDDRAEDRQRAVAVVEELDQPSLLGPVGLGGDPTLQKPPLPSGLACASTLLTCEWPATQAITCGYLNRSCSTSSPRWIGCESRGSRSQPGLASCRASRRRCMAARPRRGRSRSGSGSRDG